MVVVILVRSGYKNLQNLSLAHVASVIGKMFLSVQIEDIKVFGRRIILFR